jgi:ribonuclease BN (tRNA processing enzyme)
MAVKVTVLGAGDAFASKGRFQAAYLLDAGASRVLLDAGPTLLAGLKRAAIATNTLDLVLISHLHGDHFSGLPFLLLEYLYENPLPRKLTIAGPPHLEERTWALFRNMYPETDITPIHERLEFVVLHPSQRTILPGGVNLQTLRTPHMVNEISMAYRVEIGGRVVVFSGDTGWSETLIDLSAGSDLFLCECTYYESGHLRFHINYPELHARHRDLRTGRLVLTHLGREVLAHRADIQLELAHDLMAIDV